MQDNVKFGSQEVTPPFANWHWYDWVILIALAGIGWGALFGLAYLAWIEWHFR